MRIEELIRSPDELTHAQAARAAVERHITCEQCGKVYETWGSHPSVAVIDHASWHCT
jgi:hypothetical protein